MLATPPTTGDPWAQLRELRAGAQRDETARIQYGAALRDFRAAGWTYREIGKAIGVSHESVRLALLALPGDVPGQKIDVPRRTKSLRVRPIPEMDPVVAGRLQDALAAAVAADPDLRTPSGVRAAVADYFAALHRAAEVGWSAHSIATALGSQPKSIYKFIALQERYGDGNAAALPPAPERDEPLPARARPPALPPVQIPDAAVQELHRLDSVAFSGSPAVNPALASYQRLLGEWYLRGASRQELERATGQQWETIRKRLVSAGYMAGKPQRPAPQT